jgi:hypothetical protein
MLKEYTSPVEWVRRSRSTGRLQSGEVAQEGVSGTEREKTESNALWRGMARKDAVEDFMSGAVTAHREKPAIALGVGFERQVTSVAGTARSDDVNLQAFFAQTGERRSGQFGRFAPASSRIDDGQKPVFGRRKRGRNHRGL